jgi:Domain of unknown function (DUF1841).
MRKHKEKIDTEEEDEEITERVMREHPEYSNALEDIGRVYDPDTEVNPYMHLEIHKIIEKQLSANDLPEVNQTLDRLIKSGLSRHESIHKIGTALAAEIYDIMKTRKPFDEKRYVNRLKKLR